MYKWSGLVALLIVSSPAWASDCNLPVQITEHSPRLIESQRLLLPGAAKLQFALGKAADTFAHLGDMLLVKYDDGAHLSYRILDPAEFRTRADSRLALPDFIRLVFGKPVANANADDLADARAHQDAIRAGCRTFEHYRLDDIEVYGYGRTRSGNEPYHALFVLDGPDVHFIDIRGSETLPEQVVSTLSKRNRREPLRAGRPQSHPQPHLSASAGRPLGYERADGRNITGNEQ
jgi:hypothetical protein